MSPGARVTHVAEDSGDGTTTVPHRQGSLVGQLGTDDHIIDLRLQEVQEVFPQGRSRIRREVRIPHVRQGECFRWTNIYLPLVMSTARTVITTLSWKP